MKISAILMYHDFEIPLKVNRLIHKGHITSEQYQQLFEGICDVFNSYMQKKEDIIHCPDLSGIKRCLGKKRCTTIDFDGLELMHDKRDLVAKRIIDKLTWNFQMYRKKRYCPIMVLYFYSGGLIYGMEKYSKGTRRFF